MAKMKTGLTRTQFSENLVKVEYLYITAGSRNWYNYLGKLSDYCLKCKTTFCDLETHSLLNIKEIANCIHKAFKRKIFLFSKTWKQVGVHHQFPELAQTHVL